MDFYIIKRQLKYRKYSTNTIDTYISCLKRFQYFIESSDTEINEQSIKEYLLYLSEKNYSRSSINQHINAIKFYLEKVLNQPRRTYYIDRPRKEKKLPSVLSKAEVQKIFRQVENIKHKTILTLIYSSGLRISELINLKIEHIDSDRMLIHIKDSKGAKDRMVPLSIKVLELMRSYYKQYDPVTYLFNGEENIQYSATSIRKILHRAARKAFIKKNVTPHTLRHSYATHLLESGIDLRYIQTILGHSSVKTTEVYTHVTTKNLQNIKSPIDEMQL